MDDTNLLSEAEAKYFDTKGQAELPMPTESEAVEKSAGEEKPAAEIEVEPAAKTEEKAPAQIEVVAEDDVSDGEEPDGRKYVKVGALRKEREKTKQFRTQVEAANQRAAQLEQRLRALEQPQRETEPAEVVQQTANELRQIKQALGERDAKQQFISTYQQKAQEFITGSDDEPGVTDFPAAYKHALDMRRAIYETAGYNQQQVNALLESEEAAIVERALMDGENPAKRIYQIAQKLGYAPKATEKDDPVNEQVKKQADTADKTLLAAKKLEKIAKGMDKNKSLSGGGAGNEAPSLEELLDMPEEEFSKHTDGKKWAGLMGG